VRSVYVALIRHAPTAWNAEGRILGHANPPLSPEGARAAASWRLPPDLQARAAQGRLGWAASPLHRTMETARVLGAVGLVPEPRLIEQDWGEWTGQSRADLLGRTSEAGWGMTPPGGESPARVLARVRAWLDELPLGDGPDTWVVVTHMGVIRAVVAAALRWNLDDPAPVRLLPACFHRVRRRGDGLLQLVGLNEPLVP
jgi:probable phosphoglycerate mutase